MSSASITFYYKKIPIELWKSKYDNWYHQYITYEAYIQQLSIQTSPVIQTSPTDSASTDLLPINLSKKYSTIKTGVWSQDEDTKLKELVKNKDIMSVTQDDIDSSILIRTVKQVRER